MSIWNRLNSKIQKHGILPSIWLAVRFILRKTIGLDWNKIIILERLMEEPIQQINPKIQVKITRATEDDLNRLKTIVDETKYHIFHDRLKKGRICFIALDDDKIIALK
jgi:hypothetical protein